MGIFSPPKPPDPVATANAQAGLNKDSAVSTQLVNSTDQITPDGNLTYSQSGNWSYVDANGKTVTVPHMTATQSLNPIMQESKTYQQTAERDSNKLASGLLTNANSILSKPTDYSEASIGDKVSHMINPRLEERFGKDRTNLETALINRGVRQGSQAYDDALQGFERGRTDAYTQEGLSNRQQAINELGLPARDVTNTISTLTNGGQMQAPQFANTPQANIGSPDYMGQVNSNYQAKVSKYNAMMGGLFGLAGAGLKAKFG
jgi:hypothetical protein